METFAKIQVYLEQLDEKDFRNYTIVFFFIIFLLNGFIIYRYYSNIRSLKKNITNINISRRQVKSLLERYELVKKQQEQVEKVLEKEKDFKIIQYFDDLLTKQGLAKNKTQPFERSQEEVLDGYTEWKLYGRLNNINTKQLTELLFEIEQNERIYTKELEIDKPTAAQLINVGITIATLEPKPEEVETE